eukprot:CAMPEP_0175745002 /NCGR_PEP_ID=MMETSP0097-20121207/57845_1 /TAXON_ID=311494 /ORGANISM="Alexandrium monilatum, Strain CCMP3105" /LENGTH=88 /DNA_ID=CAMNT_0017053383 /DNA_START=30 /DNA_END=292 /DNA_ORIENTATION=+
METGNRAYPPRHRNTSHAPDLGGHLRLLHDLAQERCNELCPLSSPELLVGELMGLLLAVGEDVPCQQQLHRSRPGASRKGQQRAGMGR